MRAAAVSLRPFVVFSSIFSLHPSIASSRLLLLLSIPVSYLSFSRRPPHHESCSLTSAAVHFYVIPYHFYTHTFTVWPDGDGTTGPSGRRWGFRDLVSRLLTFSSPAPPS